MGYHNVIFDELKFFGTYEKDNLIKESAQKHAVDIYLAEPYIPEINTEDKDFLEEPVRNRRILVQN